jgi:hypothetical protein
LGIGTASAKLFASGEGSGNSIRTEERVQVRFVVLSREDDRINVLVHERGSDIDLSVSLYHTGESTDQQGAMQDCVVQRHDEN